jgi:hypothetical protein
MPCIPKKKDANGASNQKQVVATKSLTKEKSELRSIKASEQKSKKSRLNVKK